MNKEPVSLTKLKGWMTKGQFLDVANFVNKKTSLHFIITYKGTGKSYSAMKLCVERMLNENKEFAWIRNTEIEMRTSGVRNSFIKMLNDFGESERFFVDESGVYEWIDKKKKVKLQKGIFLYMSRASNISSQNALERCFTIVYDEAINKDFHSATLHTDFMKMCDTLKRKNRADVFVLGNKNESANDLLSESGVEFNWTSMATQVEIDEAAEIDAYYVERYKILEMEESKGQIDNWSRHSKATQRFTSGGIHVNNMDGVKSWVKNKLEEKFSPLFKWDYEDTRYVTGWVTEQKLQSDGEVVEFKSLYIRNIVDDEYEWLPCFCFKQTHKLPNNVYVGRDSGGVDLLELMLGQYAMGNLNFSSHHGLVQFTFLKAFLEKTKIV